MAKRRLITTAELVGKRVFADKANEKHPDATAKVGKVRYCVFHPRERRCVGFIVKRPDAALMFHRKDVFVQLQGYDLVDGRIVIRKDPQATDKGACKALGITWDECVLWVGLPVMSSDGTAYGLVKDVTFDADTGEVVSLGITQGATANVLLGVREVPADLILGFKRGMGAQLNIPESDEEEPELGAILVSDKVLELEAEGGIAEKAGEATAVVADRARTTIDAAKDAVKPVAGEAAKTAGDAINKGAYATGRQLKRAKGMFSAFKEEFDKARKE